VSLGRRSRAERTVRAARERVAPEPSLARRWGWPLGIAATGLAWYSADSLRHRREQTYGYEILAGEEAAAGSEGFLAATEAVTGFPVIEGNEADLLINGDRIFPAILETIRGAERTLNLQTYIYWQGDIADEVAAAVADRARAGVECRVLLDALGSLKMRPTLIKDMESAGVKVVRFRKPRPYLLRRLVHRSHRRVIVADGVVGLTGGVGIAEEWTGDAEGPGHWRDSHVLIRGPVVRSLQGAFAEHWVEATGEALVGADQLPPIEPIEGGSKMQIVRSSAGVGDTNVEVLYFLAIASAQESIEITAAYFAPRPPFVTAMCDAASRGVRVRVLVPGPHIDKNFVRIAGRHVYRELLECGVEIHEFQPTMLHAKSMVVDGAWSSIGTVNFDNRSFQYHDEITLCSLDPGLARGLTEQFESDLQRSERIDPERWEGRGPVQRASEASTRLIRREL
jgi:cardiolipin synthase